MKKYVFLLASVFLLGACSDVNNSSPTGSSTTTVSTQKEQTREELDAIFDEAADEELKKENDSVPLTDDQLLTFEKYCDTVSLAINELEKFNNLLLSDYDSLDDTANTEILIATQKIEGAYREIDDGPDAGKLLDFLQESNLGFLQISKNMLENKREFTDTEAYGCLNTLRSYAEMIGEHYGLKKDDKKQLGIEFLNALYIGDEHFLVARDTLLEDE